jgi:hypothetical protein
MNAESCYGCPALDFCQVVASRAEEISHQKTVEILPYMTPVSEFIDDQSRERLERFTSTPLEQWNREIRTLLDGIAVLEEERSQWKDKAISTLESLFETSDKLAEGAQAIAAALPKYCSEGTRIVRLYPLLGPHVIMCGSRPSFLKRRAWKYFMTRYYELDSNPDSSSIDQAD